MPLPSFLPRTNLGTPLRQNSCSSNRQVHPNFNPLHRQHHKEQPEEIISLEIEERATKILRVIVFGGVIWVR